MGEFGTNQKIAVGVIGSAILASIAFVVLNRLTGAQWLEFCDGFVRWALGIVLFGSAAIKVTQAIKGTPQESQATTPPAPTP